MCAVVYASFVSDLVTVGTYLDVVEAELARTRLDAAGIRAFVVEPTSFNPILTSTAGGVRLEVSERDATRARAVLASLQVARADEEDDEIVEGTVRCPRCENEYCFFERPSIRGAAPAAAANVTVLVVQAALRLGEKRWTCHTCGHRWDDPNEGPKRRTRLLPDDPRPVFRLRRGSPGMGLQLGVLGGCLVGLPFGVPVWLGVLGGVAGWLIGRSMVRDVCSEPACRAPLEPRIDACPRCKGVIGGSITRAHEHHVEAAAARRAIVADREAAAEKKKRNKPKPARLAAG